MVKKWSILQRLLHHKKCAKCRTVFWFGLRFFLRLVFNLCALFLRAIILKPSGEHFRTNLRDKE